MHVTVQVIQGLEAGAVIRNLETPITIGREEENLVQLNDERVSRFHAKIQSQGDTLILTDLQSTNGTRVNGHFTRMREIQIGDQLALGRCILIVGSPEELALLADGNFKPDESNYWAEDPTEPVEAFPFGPPDLPVDLPAEQVAGLATLLEYTRTEILTVLSQVAENESKPKDDVILPHQAWHRLQQLPLQLADYLNEMVDPSDP